MILSTDVYRKATHTDQYLAFNSHHLAAHKRAVVRTLMCRSEKLFSSGVSQVQEEKCINGLLQRNGLPAGSIKRYTLPQQGRLSEDSAAQTQ